MVARHSSICSAVMRLVARYFPKEEGMMQHSDVGISLSDETKVIELVGEPSNNT